jgi:hypothetical protein
MVAPGLEGLGERLVRYTLDVLKDPETRSELVSLARTGVNAGHAVSGLQDFLEQAVVDRIATMIGVPDARMRSALITSYLLGVATTRYGVRLEPLASASEDEVIRMVAPVIQDLLDPRKPLPGRARASRTGPAAPSPVTPPRTAPLRPPAPEGAGDDPVPVPVPTPAPIPPEPRRRTFDPDPKATAARRAASTAAGEGARHAAPSPPDGSPGPDPA